MPGFLMKGKICMNTSVTFEILTPERLDECLSVLIPLYEPEYEPYIRDEISRSTQPNDLQWTTIIALIDGRVAGAVQVLLNYVNTQSYDLIWLSVGKDYQGQGLSRGLLAEAERYVAHNLLKGEKGSLMLADFTRHKNPTSDFYIKAGYTLGPEMHDGASLMIKILNNDKT
jgi:GNAT superfamily N-acetyltransferase